MGQTEMNVTRSFERCSKCNSSNIKRPTSKVAVFIIGVIVVIAALWVRGMPFGSVIGTIAAAVGALLAIASPFIPQKFQCKDCKDTWTYQK